MTAKIEPEFIVESHRVHYQRVSIPASDGVPVPRGVRVGGMPPAIHENLPKAVSVAHKQEENMRGILHDSPRIRGDARNSGWQAIRLRIVLGLPLVHDR